MTRTRVWIGVAFVAAFGVGVLLGRLVPHVAEQPGDDSGVSDVGPRPVTSRAAETLEAAGVLAQALEAHDAGGIPARRVATALAGMGPAAVPDLVAALHDRRQIVRDAAALALGKLGAEQAIAPLLRAPERTPAPKAEVLAEALAQLGQPARTAAISALRDPSLPVRQLAALTCGKLGDGESVIALVRQLDDQSASKEVILEALADAGHPAAVAPLMAYVRQPSARRRGAAIDALGEIGDERAVPALIECLGEPELRAEACRALGHVGDATAVPALVKMLTPEAWADDRSGDVYVAAQALANIGDPAALPALSALVESAGEGDMPDLMDAMAVAALISSLGGSGRAELTDLLGHDSDVVAGAAGYGLAAIGDASGLRELLALETDAHASEMKFGAIVELARSQPHTVAALLDPQVADASTRRRLAAHLTPGSPEWGRAMPPPPIRRALMNAVRTDPDADVRRAAQEALDAMGRPAD